jgi:ATP synthase protein I
MTTATPGPSNAALAPGVRGAALAVLAVGLVAVATAALISTSAAVLGAAIGALMVLVFFAFGAVTVNAVASVMPAASLLVALLTYTLEVVALALVFVGLSSSGLLDDEVDRTWLGLTAIASTLAWTTAQIIGAVRARQPAYDLPAADAPSGATPGGGERHP